MGMEIQDLPGVHFDKLRNSWVWIDRWGPVFVSCSMTESRCFVGAHRGRARTHSFSCRPALAHLRIFLGFLWFFRGEERKKQQSEPTSGSSGRDGTYELAQPHLLPSQYKTQTPHSCAPNVTGALHAPRNQTPPRKSFSWGQLSCKPIPFLQLLACIFP